MKRTRMKGLLCGWRQSNIISASEILGLVKENNTNPSDMEPSQPDKSMERSVEQMQPSSTAPDTDLVSGHNMVELLHNLTSTCCCIFSMSEFWKITS